MEICAHIKCSLRDIVDFHAISSNLCHNIVFLGYSN